MTALSLVYCYIPRPRGKALVGLLTVLLGLSLALELSVQAQSAAPATAESGELKTAGNLVPNGGFEETDQSGAPIAWGKGDPEKGLSWQEEKGEHFMRLVSQDSGKPQMLYRVVPLPAGLKGMEVTFRYRTASVVKGDKPPGDARAIMHYQQADGKKIEPAPPAITFSPNKKEWTEVTKRFLVPAGANALEMMPGLWNVKSGTLDIAEIRVKPMTDAEVAAMLKAKEDEKALQEKRDAIIAKEMALPSKSVELKVSGSKVLGPDGKSVWLQGLCVDSMEWSYGERVQWSLHVAIDEWKSNAIRLPVSRKFWFGKAPYQKPGSEEEYRKKVDEAVKLVSTKGGWLVLDLHGFGAPTEGDLAFWKDAAARYKNNPAVIFELFNEPHGISWKIWRDGGNVKSPENVSTDVNPSENSLKLDSDIAIGMQTLINAVRETGAKNIIIAGGVDWGYDLTGVVNAPLSDPSGNGIIYSSHIYPWKKDWQPKVLDAAAKYPIFIGEVGTPPDYSSFSFIPMKERYPIEGWANDMIALIQKHELHWTGFSFHPNCGPMVIKDWDYTPTPYWGIYVKEALQGKKFELKALR